METNPGDLERLLKREKAKLINRKATRRYRKRHPQKVKEILHKNYQKNKEDRRIYNKNYKIKNKNKIKQYQKFHLEAFKNIYFVLIKGDEQITTTWRIMLRKLKEGWKIKAVDWSKFISELNKKEKDESRNKI